MPTPQESLLSLIESAWNPAGKPVPGPVPWPDVVAFAAGAGLGPLLRRAIACAGLAVPGEVAGELGDAYFQAATANAARFHDLAGVLAAFGAARVPVVLLKGAALAHEVYCDPALRPMHDFDLLIHPETLPRSRTLLLEQGFTATEIDLAPGVRLAYRNDMGFARCRPYPFMIDLHWHLVDVPYYVRRLPVDWFWQRSHAVELEGQPARALDPEANLLYLAAHLALHHRLRGERWLVDLAWLVHRSGKRLDWEEIIDAARCSELLLALRDTLETLSRCWPSLPLDAPRRRLAALKPTPYEARIYRLLTAEPRSSLLDFYTDLVCLPDLPGRLHFALTSILPRPAYMRRRYGAAHAWELPYWYARRIGGGLFHLARILPQARHLDGPQGLHGIVDSR